MNYILYATDTDTTDTHVRKTGFTFIKSVKQMTSLQPECLKSWLLWKGFSWIAHTETDIFV